MPHISLGNCHAVTFLRNLRSSSEYVEIKFKLPREEVQSIKLFLTDAGNEITGNQNNARKEQQ